MVKSDLLKNLVFIAQHKNTGIKVEFMYRDLYGYDSGEIYLESSAYESASRALLPVGPDDINYVIRLKREGEVGDIRPIEIVSVALLRQNYSLAIVFSNNETIEVDLASVFTSEET